MSDTYSVLVKKKMKTISGRNIRGWKVKALMEQFGYSKQEALCELEDMGEF